MSLRVTLWGSRVFLQVNNYLTYQDTSCCYKTWSVTRIIKKACHQTLHQANLNSLHSILILSSHLILWSCKCDLENEIFNQNFVDICFTHVCNMPCVSHTWFDHSNSRRVHIMKLSLCCSFHSPVVTSVRYKYSQLFVLIHS